MARNSNPIQIYSDRVAGQSFQTGVLLQAPVDQVFYIATRSCTVQNVKAIPVVAGTDAGTVTCTVRRCQGTEAPSAGDDLLGTTKIDLKGTVNTLQEPALTSTTADLTLSAGDRLAIDVTGTPTAVVCYVQAQLVYT